MDIMDGEREEGSFSGMILGLFVRGWDCGEFCNGLMSGCLIVSLTVLLSVTHSAHLPNQPTNQPINPLTHFTLQNNTNTHHSKEDSYPILRSPSYDIMRGGCMSGSDTAVMDD